MTDTEKRICRRIDSIIELLSFVKEDFETNKKDTVWALRAIGDVKKYLALIEKDINDMKE